MNMQTIYLPMIIFQVFLKEMPINKFANGCGQYLVLVKEDWEKWIGNLDLRSKTWLHWTRSIAYKRFCIAGQIAALNLLCGSGTVWHTWHIC